MAIPIYLASLLAEDAYDNPWRDKGGLVFGVIGFAWGTS